MAVVVLGQHHGERTEEVTQPNRGWPSELAGVAPPHVKLTYRETGQSARPRKVPDACGNGEVRNRPEKTVEQHRRVGREYCVIEVRTFAVMMGAQM
jgi:hypothetical protein